MGGRKLGGRRRPRSTRVPRGGRAAGPARASSRHAVRSSREAGHPGTSAARAWWTDGQRSHGGRVPPRAAVHPGRDPEQWQAWASCCLPELGTATGADFARGFELAIARGTDLVAATGEEVGRGDVADRAVQADRVVVLDELGDECARLVEGARGTRSDRVGLDGLVVALQLPVRLRVVRRRPHVGHAGETDVLLEVCLLY